MADSIGKLKIFLRASLIGVIIFILYNLLGNIFSGEEGRVRKFILRGKKAVEQKNIFICSDMISTNYQDKYGNGRQEVLYIAKELFSYYQNILINIEKMDIKLQEAKDKADIEIVALVVGQSKEKTTERILEGERGRFRARLIKEEKGWKLLELEFFEPLRIMGQDIS